MSEAPVKVPIFSLDYSNSQKGYYFFQDQVDNTLKPYFNSIGRTFLGGTVFLGQSSQGIRWYSAAHCFENLLSGTHYFEEIKLADGSVFRIKRDKIIKEG